MVCHKVCQSGALLTLVYDVAYAEPSASFSPVCSEESDEQPAIINNTGNIDYDQLYAQLEHEVSVQRLRYHLTREEEQALMKHNQRYQRLSQLGEQLLTLFEKPKGTSRSNPDGGKWMTLKEISSRLKSTFKSAYMEDSGCYIRIGNFLSRPEERFESERRASGMVYWIRER